MPQQGPLPQPTPPAPPAPLGGPSGRSNADILSRPRADSGAGGGPVDSQLNIAMQALKTGESPTGIRGPVIKSGRYAGERAIGDYQIMPGNVKQWSKEILGREMTPEQLEADKGAQEQIARGKMSQYYKATGSWRDAASIWHSGKTEAAARASGAHDQNITTASYVDKYAKNFARAANGDKLAVAGISQTPEGKAALVQASQNNLDIRSVVRAFIASNPNAQPGDMIRAMKELEPFMNMESQAQNRQLQEAERQERMKETEQYHQDLTKDREQREKAIEQDRANREQDRQDEAARRKAANAETVKKNAETAAGKAQAEKDQLDKNYQDEMDSSTRTSLPRKMLSRARASMPIVLWARGCRRSLMTSTR